MFLFTPSYFTERISVPGGLADYVAEFITQFYYVYALGTILLALVFFCLQRLTWVLMRRSGVSPSRYLLSFISTMALWALMGNENVLLFFAIVNSARRYMYDIQESILNGRLSGRCMKRIAGCFIVDGQYTMARKYLDVLKQSLFYRRWALDSEQALGKDALIEANADWKRARQFRFRKNFLYSYEQAYKMFGLLFTDNTGNKMALSYFMGDMLLKGKVQKFMGYMAWVQRYGGYQQMPVGYADALECIQSHGRKSGLYAEYVQRMIAGKDNVNAKQ